MVVFSGDQAANGRWFIYKARASHIAFKMKKNLLQSLIELYVAKNPKDEPKAKNAYSRENALGFVRLCDSSGTVLLRVKKDDIDAELQAAKEKSRLSSEKKARREDAAKLSTAISVKTLAGVDDNCSISITNDKKELFVIKSTWADPLLIVKKQSISDCLVEEVRTEQKKSMSGSIAKGLAFGFVFGGVGAIAGATSGNFENIIFKIICRDGAKYLCEAKQELFKSIYSNSKEFS